MLEFDDVKLGVLYSHNNSTQRTMFVQKSHGFLCSIVISEKHHGFITTIDYVSREKWNLWSEHGGPEYFYQELYRSLSQKSKYLRIVLRTIFERDANVRV
jgi:hypothetical protein